MYIDPYHYLREHQRHVARTTEDGLRRRAAGSNPRPLPARAGLVDRVARRIREVGARPVAQ